MGPNSLEIYKQRYETWRHLDKLKWQMVQLLVAIASVSAVVIKIVNLDNMAWFWLLDGVAVCMVSFSLMRISQGIQKNSLVLSRAGEAIGDTDLPPAGTPWQSVTHYIALAVGMAGVVMIFVGVLSLS